MNIKIKINKIPYSHFDFHFIVFLYRKCYFKKFYLMNFVSISFETVIIKLLFQKTFSKTFVKLILPKNYISSNIKRNEIFSIKSCVSISKFLL